MMHRLTTIALSATLLSCGCTTPRSRDLRSVPDVPVREVATLPMPGSPNRFRGGSNYSELVSAGQFLPAYGVRFQGVLYVVAVTHTTVVYVGTSDPRFQSPEGLRVGDSWQKVREHGGSEPRLAQGWAYHSALPSGWYAAFDAPEHPYPALAPEARVRSFFQRQ